MYSYLGKKLMDRATAKMMIVSAIVTELLEQLQMLHNNEFPS